MSGLKRFSGKVVIVTASTDGIGYAIAKRFAEEGAKVVVSSRKQKNVDDAVKSLRSSNLDVHGLVCHMGNEEHRTRLVQETLRVYGGVDILINNAAVNPHFGSILDISPDAWDKIFDINVKAAFFLAKDCIPHMKKRGGGSVIFVSSIAGYRASAVIGPYGVSKTTLLGLVKAMSEQCSQMNIRINAVAPGLIKTSFSQALWSNPEILNKVTKQIPMRRIGLPDEISGAVTFLASDKDASYISGETIVIAGGEQAHL